jgi:hypothetical protein
MKVRLVCTMLLFSISWQKLCPQTSTSRRVELIVLSLDTLVRSPYRSLLPYADETNHEIIVSSAYLPHRLYSLSNGVSLIVAGDNLVNGESPIDCLIVVLQRIDVGQAVVEFYRPYTRSHFRCSFVNDSIDWKCTHIKCWGN